MCDVFVIGVFEKEFAAKTKKNCETFVDAGQNNSNNFHFTVIDERDIYISAVSLKNIQLRNLK